MRTLASIQSINEVESIPNADAIERARILGWWVVVKKGEFHPGDRIVYCEIDSLLPERPEFAFLRPSCFKPAIVQGESVVQPAGFRIKTVKLRGQVSQGICFPLSILPRDAPTDDGADVTEFLGIRKYEPPIPIALCGKVKGSFPGFLSKTDETRVQVLETVLARHRGKTFYVTEKVDGASLTAFYRDGQFGVCSRNLWMDETDETNEFARISQKLELPRKLEEYHRKHGVHLAVQGELLGPGIQGNKYRLAASELRAFNVFDIDRSRLLDRDRALEAIDELGLQPVPQLGTLVLDHTVDELVEFSIGHSALHPRIQREGIVARPAVEEYDEDLGGRLSFKVINPKFLLKFDD